MKRILFAFSLVLFAAVAFAQGNKDIKFNYAKLMKVGDEAVLTFTAFTNKCVKCNQLVVFSPRLEYNGKNIECVNFEVVGKTKAKILRRKGELTNTKPSGQRYGVKNQVAYTFKAPYSPEMVNAKLKIYRTVETCCDKKNLSPFDVPLYIDPSMKPAPAPVPVAPAPVKVMPKETKVNIVLDDAISFKLGKSVIDMDMKNNKIAADKVIAAIKEIKNIKGAKIIDISIVGFASPDGPVSRNNILSKERAVSFMEAIIPATELEKWMFKVEVGGEDWAHLKSLVEASNIENKTEILNIINDTQDPETRQAKLESTAGYNFVFSNFYPQLRNAGFVKINYTVVE